MDSYIPNLNEYSSASNFQLVEGQPCDRDEHRQSAMSDSSRSTVPAACIACRTKHLKCDGKRPCSRCATNSLSSASCAYVRSRRGYKAPRRSTKQVIETTSQSINSGGSPLDGVSAISSMVSVTVDVPYSQSIAREEEVSLLIKPFENHRAAANVEPCPATPWSPATDLKNRCLEAFFHFFSPAHPFVLPKSYLTQMLKTRPLPHLEASMRYVGSYYVKTAPTESMAQEVLQLLSRHDCVRDGFIVQAMMLLAIAFDGNTEYDKANEMLKQAQDLALEIGMNRQDYAVRHGEGSLVLEESWRRTWWELYVVDGMIAGVHESSSFRLSEIPIETLLPCEEQEYISGQIPTPHSIEEFEDRSFANDDVIFSSYAYRIAAIRNLGRILRLQQIVFPDDPIIDQIDAYLVNWGLHLPESKKLAIASDGHVDEMLFQAYMITNACTIRLHRPLSQLDTSVVQKVTSCAPFRAVAPGQIFNIHAAKIIQAAEGIDKLIMLPTPLIRHTHFFTCIITLASIVHLSYWAALLPLSYDENLKQQIRLTTGALKSLAEVWPSAIRVAKQVKGVAQEIFASRKLAASEGFWGTLTDDEMMRSIIEDEIIISGF